MDKKLKDLESLANGMESNVYTSCVINIFPQDIDNIRWAIEKIKSRQMEVVIKTNDLPEVKEMLSKLQSENELLSKKVETYEKEIDRLYSERFKGNNETH